MQQLLDGAYKGETYNLIGGVPKARIKAPVDSKDISGRTALWYAAKAGHPSMTRLLLEHGASVNAADAKVGSSALVVASAAGHAAVVAELIKAGAAVNATNLKGNTALCVAKTAEVARLLLSAGADPTMVNMASGEARHPTGVQKAYLIDQTPKGGPPRGNALAAKNWQPTVRRRLNQPRATYALCGKTTERAPPPGQGHDLHFGFGRPAMIWSTEDQPPHGRSTTEVPTSHSCGSQSACQALVSLSNGSLVWRLSARISQLRRSRCCPHSTTGRPWRW